MTNVFVAAREASTTPCLVCGQPYILNEIDKNLKGDELKSRVIRIFKKMSLLSSTLPIPSPSTSTLTPISGGITNALYLLSTPNSKHLIRIFGGEGMIDRDIETEMYSNLADYLGGISYHGRFGNGRIEGFLEGYSPCTLTSMRTPSIIPSILKLHSYIPPSGLGPTELWNQLDTWLSEAKDAQEKVNLPLINSLNLSSISLAIKSCKSSTLPLNPPIVFCHNDLLSGNIMSSGTSIQLIDFEYGSPNYAAFDIANHFNEYAGGTDTGVPDYTLLMSSKEMREWITIYVEKGGGEVEEVMEMVERFMEVNHYYWGLWAIVQARNEGVEEFPYDRYAYERFAQGAKERKKRLSASKKSWNRYAGYATLGVAAAAGIYVGWKFLGKKKK
ncbi:hypothetical protein TrST_g985 [Triparma strigata]|uniref:ethanolamine kinase n=1 Tax=Triparma strigata TaxID=1606541 RepID=A0A9W7C2Z2_9STRA|nr:hypothetical protein TrST_g985 [Triparma strigata]